MYIDDFYCHTFFDLCSILTVGSMATLGNGVEYRPSGIPESGDGLFATRAFAKGEQITWYDGDLKHVFKIFGKKALTTEESRQWSHWRSVPELDFVIRGIKRGFGAFDGRGGASLANHCPDQQNCAFRNGTKLVAMFCDDDFQWWPVRPTTLVALRNIIDGEELFVDYGTSGTAAHEIPAHVVNTMDLMYLF